MNFQKHPLDIGSLVFGVIFLGIVVVWELSYVGLVSGADAAWFVPAVLIGAGGLGVVLAATKDRRTQSRVESLTRSPTPSDPEMSSDTTPIDPLEQDHD